MRIAFHSVAVLFLLTACGPIGGSPTPADHRYRYRPVDPGAAPAEVTTRESLLAQELGFGQGIEAVHVGIGTRSGPGTCWWSWRALGAVSPGAAGLRK
jgi:hypothetical protein